MKKKELIEALERFSENLEIKTIGWDESDEEYDSCPVEVIRRDTVFDGAPIILLMSAKQAREW
jgi:hypothetical protein